MNRLILFAARVIRPACALLALTITYPATATVITINFDGTFGTPTAGFPIQNIARFEGTFAYDDLNTPMYVGYYSFPISTSFTFYDADNNIVFNAGYNSPDSNMRVFDGSLFLSLGPGQTGPTDPSDFRLIFQGPFTASAIEPSVSDFMAATFSHGFAEAGLAPDYEEAPVTSARLFSTSTSAAPEPGTALLSGIGMTGLLLQRRRRKLA